MAGRNTRIQTVNKAAAWRLFFMQKNFCKSLVKRHSHSPITVSASKRHEHKPQSKRLQRYARDAKPRGKALSKHA